MRTQKLATLSKLKRQATNLKDTTATIVNNILNQCSINPELLDHHCSSPQQQEPNPANKADLITPSLDFPITWTCVKSKLTEYFNQKWFDEWSTTDSTKITQIFFPTVSSAAILKCTHVPHQLIQILSGHCRITHFCIILM